MCLLAGVLLAGVLPPEVLLAAEGEMVLAVSVLLEKSLALCLCSGTLGTFSLLLTGLGGIGTFDFGPC